MVSAARILFAGIGTIFVILAIGIGGGLMLARTALKESAGYQAPANTESTASVRVMLPSSAQAAQPPRPDVAAVPTPDPQTPVPPSVKQVQAPTGKQVGQVDTRKAQAQERERRRRYAERKARRHAPPGSSRNPGRASALSRASWPLMVTSPDLAALI
jgi:type IV secretory pathway VirB10-like protein